MRAERVQTVNGHTIEEYYWCGRMVVYIDNKKYKGTFEEAVEKTLKEALDE